jgi:hypothetical protein
LGNLNDEVVRWSNVVEDEKVMVEEANCYLLKVTAIKASLT